jgi:outer membrane protein
MNRRCGVLVLGSVLAFAPRALAQPAPRPARFTLEQAIAYAADHYPAVRAALEQVQASAAGVDVARAAYLPRLDATWQTNRATANNVFGQVLPQAVIPAMSGPVLDAASAGSVWGTAAGGLLAWEPFDFGLRRAGVDGAEAALSRARAGEALTRLDVQQAVAAAFLAAAAAERAVVAAQADAERRDTLARIVRALVDNQLRPGAEASRADAERAAAQTRLIQTRQAAALARLTLTRALGEMTSVDIDASDLVDRLPAGEIGDVPAASHPLAQAHQASIDAARAQEAVLARTDLPRVYLQSSVFARGSGAHPDGRLDGGADGLGLQRANWAAGVQIVVPNLFDFSSLRARKAAAAATERAESALLEEATLTIGRDRQAARTMIDAARAVAANTPVQLEAARLSASQALARYQAGLANIVEVADAQGLLAQAEYQDQLARLDVWRAALASAAAQGDLTPFIRLLRP